MRGTVLLSDGVDLGFATTPDESNNANAITSTWLSPPFGDRRFRQRFHTPNSAGCSDTVEGAPFCEFDDLLVWISAPVLLNRMVEARLLP